MDFVIKLPKTQKGHDSIWVIGDRRTRSMLFLPIREDFSIGRLAQLHVNKIVMRHGLPVSIISDRDSRFISRFLQSLKKAMGTRLALSTLYHPQTDGQTEEAIQTLEDMLCACVMELVGSGESRLTRPDIVQETTDKIKMVQEKLKAARDRQKSYADNRRKPLEFQVGDRVLLKVSPWKGLILAYRLDLPLELSAIHDTFHASNLKKCLSEETVILPLEGVQINERLHIAE
ncbi:hypothetical protein OSB04_028179 [Centaurea solstitialis]|uniref:Integrase catalytic domain-containing protein n=1 Tax=Centaurea solstitialis TaxID=347529 RepID=A0AA38T037_9ASTR|nr:hypothetical protein OSB04_028179 [Centaurea solstitialis]